MKTQIYCDGNFPICSNSAQLIHQLVWFNKVELFDIHQSGVLEKAGIPNKKAMTRIQLRIV